MAETGIEQKGTKTRRDIRHLFGQVVMWIGIAVVLMVLITGLYVSLAVYPTGYGPDITSYGNLSTPLILTGIVLIILGLAVLLFPSGLSKDSNWVLMTGPYVR
ncbi:MAG: hypothetical protein ACFFCP_07365 [Promethearchaeota archaeon]